VDVDVELAAGDVVGFGEERPDRHDPCVVDQDIQRPLRLLGGVDEGRDGVAIADVETEADGAEPRRSRLDGADVDVAQGDEGAVATQPLAVAAPIPRAPPLMATCSSWRRTGAVTTPPGLRDGGCAGARR
jgi:hypothetical protein